MIKDSEYTKYKKLIERLLQELTAEDELGQSSQRTVVLDQQSVGRLSRMDALQSQAMAQAQQRRRDVLKSSLIFALQRLEEGEFGYCADCGDEIEEAQISASLVIMKCMSCLKG